MGLKISQVRVGTLHKGTENTSQIHIWLTGIGASRYSPNSLECNTIN